MRPKKIEPINSGVRAEGTWDEICQFLRDFEYTTEEVESKETTKELNRWRPREDEDDEEVAVRTAKEASMKKRGIEEKCKDPKKELQEGEKKLANSIKEVKNGGKPKKELKDASEKIVRAISVKSIESLRKVEEFIYERFMIKFNSCYFDTGEFSVNLKREKRGEYSTKINIPNEKFRKKTQEEMVGEVSR